MYVISVGISAGLSTDTSVSLAYVPTHSASIKDMMHRVAVYVRGVGVVGVAVLDGGVIRCCCREVPRALLVKNPPGPGTEAPHPFHTPCASG